MDLQNLRDKIDSLDAEILRLFIERMKASAKVAEYKRENDIPVLNVSREREILNRISALTPDELEGYARILFSSIFELSRSWQARCVGWESKVEPAIEKALQQTPNMFPQKGVIACQGIEGAYSQQACDRMFPHANIMYFKSFEAVFTAVEKGLCQYGILPIENSTHGSVDEVYDLMRGHNFHIVRSIKLHIGHSLLAKKGAKLADIREIVSHEQALGQCGAFLATLPDVKITVCENTAVAAQIVAEAQRADIAAISSPSCAGLYGLAALKEKVHDSDNNYTRFIAISKDLEIYPGSTKISIMFSVSHTPGSLTRTLTKFSSLGLNLSKLESRPLAGTDFLYMFYIDIEASVYAQQVVSLLSELENELDLFVFLGGYLEV